MERTHVIYAIGRRSFIGLGIGAMATLAVPLSGCSGGDPWPPAVPITAPTAAALNGRRIEVNAPLHSMTLIERDGTRRVVGGLGSGAGQFNFPVDVATLNGLVYVVETGNHRVQVFDAAGTSLGFLGVGELLYPGGIDVSATEIYVSDSRNGRVVVFAPDGRVARVLGAGMLSAPRGLAVRADSLLVADPGLKKVLSLNAAGQVTGTFGADWVLPWDVVTDGKNVFVADVSASEIAVLTLDGVRIDRIEIPAAPGYLSFSNGALQFV